MGSDLTLWSYGMCQGLQLGQRLFSRRPWIHWSQLTCSPNDTSSMTCYFPQSEDLCPPTLNEPANAKKEDNTSHHPPSSELRIDQMDGGVRDACQSALQQANLSLSEFVGSATEFLFSSLSPRVVDSAVERLPLVFPSHGIVPPNLITVHIRWGEKGLEMELVDIHSYIDACHQILRQRKDRVSGSQGGTNQTNLANSTPLVTTNNSGSSQDDDPVHIIWPRKIQLLFKPCVRTCHRIGTCMWIPTSQSFPNMVSRGSIEMSDWSRLTGDRLPCLHWPPFSLPWRPTTLF